MNAMIVLSASCSDNLSQNVWDWLALGAVAVGPVIPIGDVCHQSMILTELNLKRTRGEVRLQWDVWCKSNRIGSVCSRPCYTISSSLESCGVRILKTQVLEEALQALDLVIHADMHAYDWFLKERDKVIAEGSHNGKGVILRPEFEGVKFERGNVRIADFLILDLFE